MERLMTVRRVIELNVGRFSFAAGAFARRDGRG